MDDRNRQIDERITRIEEEIRKMLPKKYNVPAFEEILKESTCKRLKEGIVIEASPEKEDLVMEFLKNLGVTQLPNDGEEAELYQRYTN
jgi:vacuolar-type H+-ATPase subunit E/Vma4